MRFLVRFLSCAAVVTTLTVIPVGMTPVYAAVQEIAAVVNDDVVSVRDLDKRMKLVLGSSGLPNNAEIRSKLMPQVLGGLINEKIMIQEARKIGVEVGQEEIEKGFATVAAQNKMEAAQFKSVLRKSGVDISTLHAQIAAQIAWGQVVQRKLRSRVIISERDVDAALERMKSKVGTTEFLTAEIFLPVADPKKKGETQRLANRLVNEIKGGKASFFKLAQQFSRAAGAAQGGDTGWLREDQLSEDVLSGLKKIKKNQVTQPIKTPEGYHIFFLRDTRTLSEDTLPSRQQVQYDIGSSRLDKLQSRHLMDLRAASFVDIRLQDNM